MIEIKNISKAIGDKEILKNVNLKINEGSIFGLLGPNGAGKSTLIRIITGIYKSDKGVVNFDEVDVYDNPEVKKHIGYVADTNEFFSRLTVKEIIKYYQISYDTFDINKFDELNKIFKVPKKSFLFALSKGNKTRLAIMLNISIRPKYLILDEPTSGLDPIIKRKFMEILVDEVAENGTTILISSHNLSDVERICDSIAIIEDGKIKSTSSIEEMKICYKKLQIAFKDPVEMQELQGEEVINISKMGRVFNVVINNEEKFINKANKFNPIFVEELNLTLEDIFIYTLDREDSYEEN
ncbi:ABC transporter ATP-binding protein [Clostridium tarantellae]|uniref:ATP-binding cassette domain-containing protein n=1 Tax=Clostridium tarantellae TaxID=39493 RepID=A0A6I1MWY0_9CLOT|nr:ABC transporter ATP-binding protein [Clostridium tarantellae]MPQ44659.1 ATP-binding cassette domain-containing protein [Clostridium tarantellae]